MISQIKRTLNKQTNLIKSSLSDDKSYSKQDILLLFSSLQSQVSHSFETILNQSDKKFSESKNQLKKKNKAFNELKTSSQTMNEELVRENQDLKKQLDKYKSKVSQLLKNSQKYNEQSKLKQEKLVEIKGVQCDMKDQNLMKIIEDGQKQNILVKDKIKELQQIIEQNKQDLENANILVKQLIQQLQTNVADRETWNGSGSSKASSLDSIDRRSIQSNKEIDFSDSSDQQDEVQETLSVCPGNTAGQQCSTIDGSNTTKNDFALSQWVEFDDSPQVQNKFQEIQQQLEMWPQLLCKKVIQLVRWIIKN